MASPDRATLLEIYRIATLIKQADDRFIELIKAGQIASPYYSPRGQELIPAAISVNLRPSDTVVTTYRGIHDQLGKGIPLKPFVAEFMGKATGTCKGKGGPMHITHVASGLPVTTGIVGAGLPIANGLAWAAQLRKSDDVTVCNFGDGATNIGAFHEALNLAAVWALPVVFICENNQYMEYTPIETVTAVKHPAADRAPAYGLSPQLVDGNDVEAVYATAAAAIEKARGGGGPSLIEALTYRHGGHSRADPGKYRPADEVSEWLARDPIPAYRQVLISRGVDEAVLDEVDAEAKAAVDRATEEAKAGAEPRPELAFTDVWSDGGWEWRN